MGNEEINHFRFSKPGFTFLYLNLDTAASLSKKFPAVVTMVAMMAPHTRGCTRYGQPQNRKIQSKTPRIFTCVLF